MRFGDALEEGSGADVGHDRPRPPRESGGDRKDQRVFLGEASASLIDESEALAVGIVDEAHVGVARAHQGTRLRRVFGRGSGLCGNGACASSLMASTSQPIASSQRGVSRTHAPLQQSRATRGRRRRWRGTSKIADRAPRGDAWNRIRFADGCREWVGTRLFAFALVIHVERLPRP